MKGFLAGKNEPGSGSFSRRAFELDIPAMGLGELAGIEEAESEAPDLPGIHRVNLVEFFKNLALFFFINAGTGIADAEFAGSLAIFTEHGNLAAGRSELDSIVEQGLYDEADPFAIQFRWRTLVRQFVDQFYPLVAAVGLGFDIGCHHDGAHIGFDQL